MESSPTAQEQLEGGTLGRVLISALVLLVLVSLGASAIRHPTLGPEARALLRPFTVLTGLNQNWGVFAPDPRTQVIVLEARLHQQDGTVATWRPPVRGRWVHPYRDYRWHKLAERIATGRNPELADPLARWVARTEGGPGLRAVEVVVRTAAIAPPGGTVASPAWVEESLHRYEVAP